MARPQLAAPSPLPPAPRKGADGALADFVTWDTEVSALGLRNRLGRESWIVQTRIDGRSIRRVLGVGSSLTREGYTQLADETLKKAAASVGEHLYDALTQKGRQPAITVKPPKRQPAAQPPCLPAKPPTRSPAIPPHLLREYRRSRLLIPAFCDKHGLNPKLFWKAVQADFERAKKEAGK